VIVAQMVQAAVTKRHTVHLQEASMPFVFRAAAGALLALVLTACAPAVVRPEHNPLATWTPSLNFNARKAQLIVLHHTGLPDAATALTELRRRTDAGGVSAHYLVAASGQIYQLVDDQARAWHAGAARWAEFTDLNSASIGIELDNDGQKPFAPAQIAALITLLDDLTRRLNIPRTAIVGHGDIAPGRKVDPNALFPWAQLAARGFGRWYTQPLLPAPAGFDTFAALRLVGYDTSKPTATIAAFHRHYRGTESVKLDATDASILYNLQRQLMTPAGVAAGAGALDETR
jgi:N-acetylmuramoyl-L-alanine amidase